MTEAYASMEDNMRYYQSSNGSVEGVSMPFNFGLIYLSKSSNMINVQQTVNEWMSHMPPGKTPNWVASSHDHSRTATRLGDERLMMTMALIQTLPGVSITYNGDEIGMHDYDQFEHHDSRDPNRTPMQWDKTTSAGFSTNETTWLPVNPDYATVNVEAEQAKEFGNLAFFKQLTAIRKDTAFSKGEFLDMVYNRNVYMYLRYFIDGEGPRYLIVLNYHGNEEVVNIQKAFPTMTSQEWTQVASSSSWEVNG